MNPKKPKPRPLRADVLTDLELPSLPEVPGGFQTVLADPPWRFQNRTGKIAPEHRRLDRYDTMSLDQICALPVESVAADNSHLYLWCPNALLPEGLQVMEAWGFRYVSNLIWAKRRKDGGPDGRGIGAELKPSYYVQATRNLAAVDEHESDDQPTLIEET